jgi:integrase
VPKLTEAFVAALPINGTDYSRFDSGTAGFGVRVTPAGKKLLGARARMGSGRRPWVTVGAFPEMTVAQARKEARPLLDAMRSGRDPVLAREERRRAAAAGEMTVAQLADKWLADYVRPKLKPRTAFDYERLLTQHILPALGHLSVASVERSDVESLHVAMARIPRRANYTISTTHVLFNHAIDLGLRPPGTNPARRIKRYRERKVERFLGEEEIGKAAEAIARAEREGKIGPHAAAGLRLALFTGARSGEITAIEWEHIDWHRKLIRLPDSKTNEPRTIHLSEAALEVLKTVPRVGPYVVAGAKSEESYKNLGRAWIVARAYAGLGEVRLHDLRHSYASLAVNRGVSLPMIGKLLGHKVPATTQRYAHLARDVVASINDQLGEAMQAAIAKQQEQSPPSGKVVKLRR